jgi:hypothetical protein
VALFVISDLLLGDDAVAPLLRDEVEGRRIDELCE